MASTPLIALTGRRRAAATLAGTSAGQQLLEIDVYFADYTERIARAGGCPVFVPREADPDRIADLADGLLLPGGDDVDPRLYGARPGVRGTLLDPARDVHEIALCRAFIARDKPILGVCRGAQLINVALGGSLVTDLAGELGAVHDGRYPGGQSAHEVVCQAGSVVHALFGDRLGVNSFHHQAVDTLGEGARVTALSDDGVVEAIEVPGRQVLGVQWHPERAGSLDPTFRWLVRSASAATAAALEQEPRRSA